MKRRLHLQGDDVSIPHWVVSLLLMSVVLSCSHILGNGSGTFSYTDKIQFGRAFEKLQIIGEGTEFLTIKCDISRSLLDRYNVYALVLDQDMQPLRKVSGFSVYPKIKAKNHLWFYFLRYQPGHMFHSSTRSQYIKFTVVAGKTVKLEHVVKSPKLWGSAKEVKIFDLPAPPDKTPGYLILKDYTFLAKGDIRKPEGYYVTGDVIGWRGRWTHFMATSNVLGRDDLVLKNILPTDQGWLELMTGATHSMKEAVSPVEPYVNGWWDAKGYFHPDNLKVYGLKKR
ncbi:MAG: hypothetical protein PVI06_04920 [Desulfobacterales bacterium]|jgi:hypothetical protein